MNDFIENLLIKIYNKIDDSNESKGLFELYQKIKSKKGKKTIIENLTINEFVLNGFEIALRSYTKNPESKVLALRLINWIKLIGHYSSIDFDMSLIKSDKKDPLLSFKQVRAIELLLRDIIYENHENQAELIKKLKTFFNSKTIDNWIKNADKTGVLSGTTFNELSTLFINKNMFEDYESIFKLSDDFKIEKSDIGTLRNLLDDIRVIRNSIAHNKEVSDVEINLLNEYYNEILRNIDIARTNGKTQIEPDKYIKVDDEEIQRYINSIEDNFEELNKKIDQNFETIKSDTEILKKGSKSSNKKLIFTLAGIFIIILVSVLTLIFQKSDSDLIKDQNQKILDITTDGFDDLAQLVKTSNPIQNPSTPKDYLLNAYLYKNGGNLKKSESSFLKFFELTESYKIDILADYLDVIGGLNGRLYVKTFFETSNSDDEVFKLFKTIYTSDNEDIMENIKKLDINENLVDFGVVQASNNANYWNSLAYKYATSATSIETMHQIVNELNEHQTRLFDKGLADLAYLIINPLNVNRLLYNPGNPTTTFISFYYDDYLRTKGN